MGKSLTWLSDAELARIEPLLPSGRCGARRVDDRRVISGIVHMLRIGARWRDCPPEYGPYHHMSEVHLGRYCAEFDLRYNTRGMTDGERAALILKGGEGRRLTYRRADKLAA